MSIRIECTSCGRAYQVAEQLSGKKVRCKNCGATIAVPGATHPDPSRTHVSGYQPPYEPPTPEESEDRSFDGMDQEEGEQAAPETSVPTGNLQVLEIVIPIAVAACCLGWMLLRALMGSGEDHGWVGPFRAAIYLLLYAGAVFPISLIGVRAVMRKLYLPTPNSYAWKAFGIFCAPMALGAVLALTADSLMMFVVGAVVGLIIALGGFVFVFGLQPRHMGKGLAIAGAYLVGGTAVGFGALFGINVLMMAVLTVSHTAGDYAESPVGSAFDWKPPPAEVEHHKIKHPEQIVDSNENTNPATEPTTQSSEPAATSAPSTLPIASTRPTTREFATSAPTTQPVIAANLQTPHTESHEPVSAFSTMLEAAPVQIMDGQAMDVYFPPRTGTTAFLVLRNRTDFGDELELYSGANWAKTLSITIQPRTSADQPEIFLSDKATMMARMIDLAHPSLQMRPLTGDPASQDKQTHVLDLEAVQPSPPSLLGISPNGLAEVLWHGSPDFLALVDPEAPVANSGAVRSRTVPFNGLQGHLSDVVLTPDGRTAVSVQRESLVSGGVPENYFVVDLMFGNADERTTMTNMPADRNIQPAGLACSTDSKRVAAMYLASGSGLIEVYHLPDGARTASQIFSGPPATLVNNFQGSAVTWIAGNSALLINGRYVLDGQSLQLIGDLGIDGVKQVYVVDKSRLALKVSTDHDPSHCSVLLATLNDQKFPGLKPTRGSAQSRAPAP